MNEIKKRILIADDEPALLRLMQFVLEKQGYHCITVENGEEAVHQIQANPPDLVILDVMMPKMDGYAVVEQIRSWETDFRLPIIMLTARAQDDDIQRGMEVGVNDYITKPFEPEKVLQTVERLLNPATEFVISQESEMAMAN